MVKVALDKSPGVIEYETIMLKRQVSVKFDPSQINEEKLSANIKKVTRYADVNVKE